MQFIQHILSKSERKLSDSDKTKVSKLIVEADSTNRQLEVDEEGCRHH